MYRKSLILLSLACLIGHSSYGQSTEMRSLKRTVAMSTDSFRKVDAMNRLAMLLYEKNVDSTFFYTKAARELAERLDYEKGKADAINNLGVVFDIKGNLQLSLKYYNDAYQRYRRLGDTANSVQDLMNIAMVYKEIGKDGKAVNFFDQALKLGETLHQDSIKSLVIYNYLLQFPARFPAGVRSAMITKAQRIAERYRDYRTLLAIDQLIADDLMASGKTGEGHALLDSAIAGALSKHLYYAAMDMMIDKGDQLAAKQPGAAADVFRTGLALADSNGYLIYKQMLARKLFELYSATGDNKNAVGYAKQFARYRDEQESFDNVSSVDYVDYAIKEQALNALSVKAKYQRWLLWLAAASCLLAALIIALVYRSWKRTRLVNREITGQNLQMQKTLGALEQSQADNTRMMKIVAHDLRNPVGGIYSIADLMLESAVRSEDDLMMINLIKTSAGNSLELVSDLLQVHTKAEDLHKEPLALDQMLRYCVDLLTAKAAAKGQRIELREISLTVLASREKLWRVVSNLIANAIKFSVSGAAIEVSLNAHDDKAVIAVKDHGIGIPADIGNKIFDMFTPSKRTGTGGEQAFGLGLAISKQIVEAHGGRIWYESQENQGTTFYVELPR